MSSKSYEFTLNLNVTYTLDEVCLVAADLLLTLLLRGHSTRDDSVQEAINNVRECRMDLSNNVGNVRRLLNTKYTNASVQARIANQLSHEESHQILNQVLSFVASQDPEAHQFAWDTTDTSDSLKKTAERFLHAILISPDACAQVEEVLDPSLLTLSETTYVEWAQDLVHDVEKAKVLEKHSRNKLRRDTEQISKAKELLGMHGYVVIKEEDLDEDDEDQEKNPKHES